ncbi:MAG: hypothetical protein KC416_08640 [Myxococcales bacterium]|nr:hypothetical protein [Myxococcales bacterium]
MIRHLLPLGLWAVLASGCMFQSLTPAAQLRDAVQDLNESARWSRLDLAQQRVARTYTARFMHSRSEWGKRVQIADLDVKALKYDEDDCESLVSISWYNQADMTLRNSVLKQTWEKDGTKFALVSESVVEGDKTILVASAEAPSTEGRETSDHP